MKSPETGKLYRQEIRKRYWPGGNGVATG